MKKLFCVLLVLSLSIFSGFISIKGERVNNSYIMVIKDFDTVDEELQQQFLDIDAPLTFVTHHRENFTETADKKFIDTLAVPRIFMSMVAFGTPSEIRNTMYTALSYSKEKGKVIVIFDLKNAEAEDVYYAIVDSLDMLKSRGANLSVLSFK